MEGFDALAHRRRLRALLAGAGAVAAWRVAALVFVYGSTEASSGSMVVQTLLALVGMAFPVCGILVLGKHPGRVSQIFAGFSICAGLHWGGPLELPSGELRTALLFFYLLVSSFLSATLFLHFALLFPRKLRLAERKSMIRLLYAPAGAATLLAAGYFLSPAGSDLRAVAQSGFLLEHTVVSNLFALLALAIFVSRLFGLGLGRTVRKYLSLMVAGMLAAWLPYLIASAVGAETDPWNLTVVALPVCFAIGILGISKASEPTP